jgi:hypothetical protein
VLILIKLILLGMLNNCQAPDSPRMTSTPTMPYFRPIRP